MESRVAEEGSGDRSARKMASSYKGYLVIIGGVLIHLTLSTVYCWGNLAPYVTSYIRKHSTPSTVTYGDTVWVFSIASAAEGFATFLGGILEKRVGIRLAALVGCSIISGSTILSAFAMKISYYAFLVSYGLLFGTGIGVAYAVPIGLAMKWFPKHSGTVSGIILAATGGGVLIFDQIQLAYINPGDVPAVGSMEVNSSTSDDEEKYITNGSVLSRVPGLFMLSGGIYLTLQLVGMSLLFPVDSDEKNEDTELLLKKEPLQQVAINEEAGNTENEDRLQTNFIDVPPLQMIKTRPFITLWSILFLQSGCTLLVSSLYKAYGQDEVVNDDKFLSALGSVSALFAAAGRLTCGIITDKLSFKIPMIVSTSILTFLFSTLYLSHVFADTVGKPLLFIWICLILFTCSGNYAMFPVACSRTFGTENITINYGILFTSNGVGGLLAATLVSLLMQTIHSYGVFILCAALSVISLLLAISFNGKDANGRTV